jgi:nitrogen regulatory protein PII
LAGTAGAQEKIKPLREIAMHFKLIIALVEDNKTETVLEAAREAGATGSTVISQARGEGLEKSQTFFGLNLETQRDVILFLVEEHLSRHILETISDIGEFEGRPGTGIAFQLDVEDAIGVSHQIEQLASIVEEEL